MIKAILYTLVEIFLIWILLPVLSQLFMASENETLIGMMAFIAIILAHKAYFDAKKLKKGDTK